MATNQLTAWIQANHGLLPPLPSIVRTKSGVEFDPSTDHWSYRDGINDVSVNFDRLLGGTSPVFIYFHHAGSVAIPCWTYHFWYNMLCIGSLNP